MKNKETKAKKFGTMPPSVPVREVNGAGSGRKMKDVIPDDQQSVGQVLVEEGMREPTVSPMADDQRRK